MNITDRVNGSPLDQEVIDILDHMQQGTYDINALDSVKIFHNTQDHLQSPHTHYLGNATPFARMWTGVQKLGQRYTENGELIVKQRKGDDYYYYVLEDGEFVYNDKGTKISNLIKTADLEKYPREIENIVYTINDSSKESYKPKMEVFDNRPLPEFGSIDNTYMKPPPGITSVSTFTDGPLAAAKRLTIQFSVPNHRDFERIIQPWFFQPGITVAVDIGWSNIGSNFDFSDLYDPQSFFDGFNNNQSDIYKFLYGRGYKYNVDYIPGLMRSPKWLGNLDITLGQVDAYSAKIDENNVYQCTLQLTSTNSSLASRELSEDNGIKHLFSNTMDDLLARVFTMTTLGSEYVGGIDITDEKYFDAADAKENKRFALDFFKSLNRGGVGVLTSDVKYEGIGPPPPQSNDPIARAAAHIAVKKEIDIQKKQGIIPQYGLTSGIFYSEISHQDNFDIEADSLYISYGLFEDLFLNKYLTPTTHGARFNSKYSYLRWDSDFIQLQNAKLDGNEQPLNFLVPTNWDNTYNSRVRNANDIQCSDEQLGLYSPKNTDDEGNYIGHDAMETKEEPQYGAIQIFPLRDLFINVPFIQQVFSTMGSISEALQTIFNKISEESGYVWNINMSTKRDNTYSTLGFTDIHLSKTNVKTYEFDCTSQNSMVISSDIEFSIPKDELQAAVAARNLGSPDSLNSRDFREMLNFMNLTPSGAENSKIFIRSIPNQGDINKNADVKVGQNVDGTTGVHARAMSELITNSAGAGEYEEGVKDTVKRAFDIYADNVQKISTSDAGKFKSTIQSSGPTSNSNLSDKIKEEESDQDKIIIEADTRREFFLEKLRKKTYDLPDEKAIHRYLPVELSLTTKGNTLLDVYDLITVNNLADFMKERVVFKITGITNSVTSENWTTTYKCIMQDKSPSFNLKTIERNPVKIPEIETYYSKEKTEDIMKDDPEEAAKGKGTMQDVVNQIVEATPAKFLGVVKGNNFQFEYEVTQMASTFKDDIATTDKNKKTNNLDIGSVSKYQDLAMGFALRDHLLNSAFSQTAVIFEEFDSSQNTFAIQLEILDKINTRNVIGQFIENENASGVSDFNERLKLINHPTEFVHTFQGMSTLNLTEQEISSANLFDMSIPTVPASISFAFLQKNDIIYKVQQTKGAPSILPEFFIPKSAIAEGVGIMNFLQELVNLYTRYYTILITMIEPENLISEEPQIEKEEEPTNEELENAPLDNNASINWEDSFVFDGKIDVDLEGIDMKAEHHFWLFQALTEIKNSVPELYQTVIRDSVKKIRSVKSEMPDQESHPSYCQGKNWYMASRPTRVWDVFKLENALEPTKYTDSWSGRSYNVCLYEMIDLVLHESYHSYQHVNKVRLYGKEWKENTFDWETPCIEWTADTMELMFESSKGNFKVLEHAHITRMIDEGRVIVAENKRNAAKDPPGKLNHADVDGDGDYDYDDVQIRNIQAAAGRNTYSTAGMTEEELMEVYEDGEIVKAILERGRFIGNTFAEYFDKIKFHFKTFVEVEPPGGGKKRTISPDEMTEQEWQWWMMNESRKGRFRTGPGLD